MPKGNSVGPPSSAQPLINNTLFCLYCCQQAKRVLAKDEEKAATMIVNPAITLAFVIIGGFPVNVPVCGEHLQVESSNLVTS